MPRHHGPAASDVSKVEDTRERQRDEGDGPCPLPARLSTEARRVLLSVLMYADVGVRHHLRQRLLLALASPFLVFPILTPRNSLRGSPRAGDMELCVVPMMPGRIAEHIVAT